MRCRSGDPRTDGPHKELESEFMNGRLCLLKTGLSIRRGQQGEVGRKRGSEHERVLALHEKQELNVNGVDAVKGWYARNDTEWRTSERPHVSCFPESKAGKQKRKEEGVPRSEATRIMLGFKLLSMKGWLSLAKKETRR